MVFAFEKKSASIFIRPRNSMDRMQACGACNRGSNPLEDTYVFI